MKYLLYIFLFSLSIQNFAQEKILFFQINWGNTLSWDAFCEKTKASGYDGIEVWFPHDAKNQEELKAALKKHELAVIFLNGTNRSLPFNEGLADFKKNLEKIITWNPVAINCHTGNDFFTFEQNKAIIDASNAVSKKHNIPIYHETHRGRFSYNLPDTNNYLKEIPELKLTLDISHWMVVHESLLQNQDKELEEVITKSHHIHARVGYAEGPQVNDPEAPEWATAVNRHLDIWEKVIKKQWKNSDKPITITTEFGPADYMHTLPYTRVPIADQWKANVYIMNAIKKRMQIK
ncbi:TIM barrel protein [Aureibaculum sp. 2210JD6-5]|uniref:sugar phosphate isomerase/epimerase family protein n=1 Tax=Aureibaculum sp. 2210JD6-5 TaxID=3103957 RepID=UPI002AAC7398|nr:TIM barrel protein [Aureibaculum sp. 2210JD6-5]MDY7394217.1 TIM barrel protein [Aureibaculum sp. 2210JD6-5]